MGEVDGEKLKEKLMQMPEIKTTVRKSKDGQWVIATTAITQIFARKYFDKMLSPDEEFVNKVEHNHKTDKAKKSLFG